MAVLSSSACISSLSSLFPSFQFFRRKPPPPPSFVVMCEEKAKKKKKKECRKLIKLVSSAGTGFFYVTEKKSNRNTAKLEVRKYDPRVKRHILFTEQKMK